MTKKRILLSPLNWGLGHASRCVPVIHELLRQNCLVTTAGAGNSLELLRKEFSNEEISFEEIESFTPTYSSGKAQVTHLLLQSSKFLSSVRREHNWLKKNLHRFDGIISDNRYGLYSYEKPSALITHQLTLPPHFLRPPAQLYLNRQLKKFSEIWIPDIQPPGSMAGDLSRTRENLPLKYLGIISRFLPTSKKEKGLILFLLSGPEPQRTLFENELTGILPEIRGRKIVVRGTLIKHSGSAREAEFIDLADSSDLKGMISESEVIVARAGYSTIMDLLSAGKKAVLLPTPGQSEQEYLAKLTHIRTRFTIVDRVQQIPQAIESELKRPAPETSGAGLQLKMVLTSFLEKINVNGQ